MTCPRCGSWCAPSDNYCRSCGDKLQMVLPPESSQRALTAFSAALPPSVVKGVALAVAGKAAEWALRRAARKLAGSAGGTVGQLLARSPAGKVIGKAVVEPQVVAPVAEALLTEVIVMWRMVRRPEGTEPQAPRRR